MKLRSIFIALGIAVTPFMVDAQISKVNYKIQFNKETNLFDCYIIVKEGQALSTRDRAQFNAQFTIVVPSGSQVKMAESNMPIQNNQNFDGVKPIQWFVSNQSLGPESDPFRDFVSIVPSLSPSGFYNKVNQGDEVKLFSLQISPISDCGNNIRLYEAGMDPTSSDRGMAGGDFSNGFTMGSVNQLYAGSTPGVTPEINVIKNQSIRTLKGKLTIDTELALDAKYGPYSFVWNGPNQFKAYTDDVVINNPSYLHEGNYTLEVSDNRGCKQLKNIEAKVFGQNIGLDQNHIVDLNLNTNTRAEQETIVSVYPNPAVNFFNLDVQAKDGAAISMELIDSKGGAILKKSYAPKDKNNHVNDMFSLSNVPSGMYNIAVSINGEINTKQLIVIK